MPMTIESIKLYFQSFHRRAQDPSKLKSAAVLILLFEKGGQLHVVLTKRTNSVQYHKGEISFPGGTKDGEDATLITTALREAEEEIGVSSKNVEVLGVYNDFITPSGFCITPVIAFLTSKMNFLINNSEVSEVFDVPLSFFYNNQHEQAKESIFNGIKRSVYYYSYGEHEIWGATAAIMRSFVIDLVGTK